MRKERTYRKILRFKLWWGCKKKKKKEREKDIKAKLHLRWRLFPFWNFSSGIDWQNSTEPYRELTESCDSWKCLREVTELYSDWQNSREGLKTVKSHFVMLPSCECINPLFASGRRHSFPWAYVFSHEVLLRLRGFLLRLLIFFFPYAYTVASRDRSLQGGGTCKDLPPRILTLRSCT